ncbi:Ctf8-domain-containing protein [Russula compacta]|nr:Ctf8-domain-containing protein [Russula compacta]
MILPLTLPPPKSSSPNPGSPALPSALARLGSSEFVLLELQGQLEVSGTKHGQLVGRLTIDDDGDKPTLRIGHHLLEGKIVSLPKPLALLQRVYGNSTPVAATTSYVIRTLIRKKIVFSKRPTPIVGLSAKTTT